MSHRILIVGAGPTGLTAAVELARLGTVPHIIDKRPGPSPDSRAVGIFERTLATLTPSGVAVAIRAEAVRFDGILFHDEARPIARLALNFDDRSRLFGLPQDRTEHFLAEALVGYGGRVDYGQTLEDITQNEDGVTAVIDGRAERFDVVLGADGSHSTVRDRIGIDFAGYDLPGLWSIADVDSATWPHPTMFQGFLLPGGDVCVVVPLAAQRFRVISSRDDALAALPVPMTVDRVRRSGTFTIPVRQAASYTRGQVYLAGDAAHCHSPVGGRGMNIGIADGADFAARLIAGTLDSYSAARHPVAAKTIVLTERIRHALQAPGAVRRRLVVTMLGIAARIRPIARTIVHRATTF